MKHLLWRCRALGTNSRSKCAWWLSIIIQNYITAVDGKFLLVSGPIWLSNKYLVKFYDILTALGEERFGWNKQPTTRPANVTIIFYEQKGKLKIKLNYVKIVERRKWDFLIEYPCAIWENGKSNFEHKLSFGIIVVAQEDFNVAVRVERHRISGITTLPEP